MDVLICEDDPVARSVISDLVEDHGGRVLAAVDSVMDALVFLQRFSADVVIVDLVLRHGRGVDLVERIRSAHPTVRVVVFTAHDAQVRLDDSIEVVVKPDFERLGRVLAGSSERGAGERRRPVRAVPSPPATVDPHAFYRLVADAHPDDVLIKVSVDGDVDEVVRALRDALRTHDAVLPRSDQVVALLLGGGGETVRAIQQRFEAAYPLLASRTTSLVVGDDPTDAFARLTAT